MKYFFRKDKKKKFFWDLTHQGFQFSIGDGFKGGETSTTAWTVNTANETLQRNLLIILIKLWQGKLSINELRIKLFDFF